MDSKPIAVLIAFLAIFAIILPGCVSPSASPGTTGPVTPDNPGLRSDRSVGTDPVWWIQIDPLPEIPVNESLVISGRTNLPEGTWLNYHVLLASRDGTGGTPGDNYGDFRGSIDVSRVHGARVWSAAISLDPSMPGRNSSFPDQCIVHVSAIHQNIYATSLVPVTLPLVGEAPNQIRFNPVGNASLHQPFTLNGTTDLPEGCLLSASVYPGIHPEERSGPAYDYDPIVQEFVTVGKNSDGPRVFSVTVNLSGHTDQNGNPLNPGDYVAEIHAVNMNSTIKGTNLTVHGNYQPAARADSLCAGRHGITSVPDSDRQTPGS